MEGCTHATTVPLNHAVLWEADEIFVVPLFSNEIHLQLMTQNSRIFPVECPGVLALLICFPAAVRFDRGRELKDEEE